MALRVALIGCSDIGRTYADLIAASGSTVLAAFDSDQDASAEFAAQTGARIAPTLDDAVTAVGVDAIVVCLDGTDRVSAIGTAATSGRPVFDAMPLHADAVTALHGVEAAGALVGVDLRLRHDIGITEAAGAARRGEIGEIRSCSIVVRDRTMSVDESMVHSIDLARYLTQSDIVDIAGVRGLGSTMLLLTHKSGVITSVEHSDHAVAGPKVRVELVGTAGTVSSEPSPLLGATVRTADGDLRLRRASDAVERSLRAQWISFVEALSDCAPSEASRDASAALRATQAAQTALAERRTVEVTDFSSAP